MQETPETAGRRPTLRELEVLRTLIAFRKATAAARKLGISQPAVSRAIHQLEKRTGLVLFRREGGRLIPTAEALALHQESEPIFLTFERLERVRWRPEEANPMLRVAAPPTLAHWFFHKLLAEFSRSEPDTRIYVEIGSGLDVISLVANGDMDLGVVDSGQPHMGVQFHAFRSSDAHAIMPASSPLAREKEITPRHLDGVPLIALARRFPSRTQLDRLFLGANIQPNIVIEVSTAVAAYEFVRAGIGVTVINPFPMSLRQEDDVRMIPFRPTIAYETSFVLPSMVPPSAVARRFMDFVRARQPEDGYSFALRAN
jgi:DNA-binding transcriptional LysR family regulator